VQLVMEELVRQGNGEMEFWAGWQWSHPPEIRPYIAGQVITPKWAGEYRGTDPVMLDNGAFAAWRDKADLRESDHVEAVVSAARKLVPRFIVLPDIVGGGDESLARSRRSAAPILRELGNQSGARLLVAVQEGMRIWEAVELAEMLEGGIFVGGAGMEWKRYAAQTVRAKSRGTYLHVGRIWKDGDVSYHSALADSFDNTTYARGQRFNRGIDKVSTLSRYCGRRHIPPGK